MADAQQQSSPRPRRSGVHSAFELYGNRVGLEWVACHNQMAVAVMANTHISISMALILNATDPHTVYPDVVNAR